MPSSAPPSLPNSAVPAVGPTRAARSPARQRSAAPSMARTGCRTKRCVLPASRAARSARIHAQRHHQDAAPRRRLDAGQGLLGRKADADQHGRRRPWRRAARSRRRAASRRVRRPRGCLAAPRPASNGTPRASAGRPARGRARTTSVPLRSVMPKEAPGGSERAASRRASQSRSRLSPTSPPAGRPPRRRRQGDRQHADAEPTADRVVADVKPTPALRPPPTRAGRRCRCRLSAGRLERRSSDGRHRPRPGRRSARDRGRPHREAACKPPCSGGPRARAPAPAAGFPHRRSGR